MNLPTTELNDLYHLGNVCLKHCVTPSTGDKTTCFMISLYPGLMAQLLETVQGLYQYTIETENQIPYFAGAGPQFIESLQHIKDLGIEIMSNHIPEIYQNATGKCSFCQSLEEAGKYKTLQRETREYLIKENIHYHIAELETAATHSIEREFIGWINKLYSFATHLIDKRETPTYKEKESALNQRMQNYIIHNPQIKDFVNYLNNRSDECLKTKIIKHKEKIRANTNPLWQQIVEEAYDVEKDVFRKEDIAQIIFEHKDDILKDPHFDDIIYQNLYLYDCLTHKQIELQNPSTKLSFQMESIQPADMSEYPYLDLILSPIIKSNQNYFLMFKKGILKSGNIVTKGQGDVCRFSHLYRVLYDTGMIIHLDLVKTTFAEAILEILKESGSNEWKKAKQITDNINNNTAVLDTKRPMKKIDKSYYDIIVGYFDIKLIFALKEKK